MSTKKVKTSETAAATTKTVTTTATKNTVKSGIATSKVTFKLAADAVENAETVAVLGSFNDWNLNKALFLTKEKGGSFKGALELTKGDSYEYRFLVNNTIWINDTNASEFKQTPYGVDNCVVVA
jgi:1,4-alpha-glucan branching enzyme